MNIDLSNKLTISLLLNKNNPSIKIIFFGNGGSASDAQHLATELTVKYKKLDTKNEFFKKEK